MQCSFKYPAVIRGVKPPVNAYKLITTNNESWHMSLTKKHVLPAFDRAAVFAEVDKSNLRFEDYSKGEREDFAKQARAVKLGGPVSHEVRRAGH